MLFNAARARGPALTNERVIAVEGYHGRRRVVAKPDFGETVAPLGTALTEDQLKLLWRFAPEPVLCFDGDARAARLLSGRSRPCCHLLKPGFSMRFALLPDGLDPDDLIRQKGAEAFAAELTKTRALFDVLWDARGAGSRSVDS